MTTPAQKPLRVFCSYSHRDEEHLNDLRDWLRGLERQGLIEWWHDREIAPGWEWEEAIDKHLRNADIILLLVTPDFMASDYVFEKEVDRAIERHERDEARVIPIIARPADWEWAPFGRLQALPKDARPITRWPDQDDAWLDVVRGVRRAVGELLRERHEQTAEEGDRIPVADTAHPMSSTLWNVPYARNPYFTGRNLILDDIGGALEDTSTPAVTQAISGLGGIGKTQTAVEYAYRHRDKYEAIFWAVADNEATITSAYAEIARLLNLPETTSPDQNRIVETVKRWFETYDKWLLILDNADSPSLVRAFLPLAPRGHILITSRAQNLDMLAIPRALDLQVMSPDEALEFLLKRTGRRDTDIQEREAAAKLAEELGWLPLALEQAGAYIAAHRARFEDYLASLKRRQLELLGASPPIVGNYSSSVSTTWSLNFEEIEQVSTAAADLLRLSAFLSPDSIPLELITRGASEMGTILSAALAQVQEDPVVMDVVLEPLIRYSLIRRDIESNTYSVHRLVQETAKAAMDEESRRIWAVRAVRAINSVFPSGSYDTWPLCDRSRCTKLTCLLSKAPKKCCCS